MSIKNNCKQLSFFSFIDPNTKIQYYNVAVRQLSCQRRLQKGYAMDLGQRLQICREAKKITQAEMAQVCHLSKNYISAIERGVNKCTAQTLIAYAEKLDMSLDELIGRENTGNIIPELRRILSSMEPEQQKKILQIIHLISQ